MPKKEFALITPSAMRLVELEESGDPAIVLEFKTSVLDELIDQVLCPIVRQEDIVVGIYSYGPDHFRIGVYAHLEPSPKVTLKACPQIAASRGLIIGGSGRAPAEDAKRFKSLVETQHGFQIACGNYDGDLESETNLRDEWVLRMPPVLNEDLVAEMTRRLKMP